MDEKCCHKVQLRTQISQFVLQELQSIFGAERLPENRHGYLDVLATNSESSYSLSGYGC
ncbi:MAG: hypothetical protein ACKVH8_00965 [Pirellulales bacterium]|jgi:hypothetical protein